MTLGSVSAANGRTLTCAFFSSIALYWRSAASCSGP